MIVIETIEIFCAMYSFVYNFFFNFHDLLFLEFKPRFSIQIQGLSVKIRLLDETFVLEFLFFFFFFLLLPLTTEAMGIWRFAGAFAVVKRQSECGRKTR